MLRNRSFIGIIVVAGVVLLAVLGGAFRAVGRTALAADVGVAATTAGCGKAPTLASGTHSIQSSGQNRSYILRVPANYDNSHPYRLFFGFHWVGGTANDVDSGGTDGYNWSYYGLRRLADNANNSTIFVAPQGISNGWANSGGQDVTFVDDMVRQIEASLCVDTTQLFAGGFSYGGSMDTCIAIRTLLMRGRTIYLQAGAGLVADSDPPREYQETLNKARALAVAIENAEQGLI